MLIPRFSLSQTLTHLSIVIRCPYVKFSSSSEDNLEVDLVTPNEFYFFCKPYHLHLFLPGRVFDENSNGESPQYKYEIETSSFHFTYAKETPNEYFEDLDLVTKLLHNEKKTKTIEEIDRSSSDEKEEDDDEPLWNQMRQLDLQDIPETSTSVSGPRYGFNHQYSDIFSRFGSEYSMTFDNHSPDSLPISSIRSSRLAQEELDFNFDSYLADKDEDNDEDNYSMKIIDELNDQDRDDLKDLKYKQLLIDNENEKLSIYLGLVDLLYAFVYDQHVTQGEPCCESPWNVHKLCSTLSWFDSFVDLPSVLIACCRRTVIYPLVRSLSLAKRCLLDVARIISFGKRSILVCLLQMRRLFLDEEHRYLLNILYLNDYCLWIQSSNGCQTNWLQSLAEAIRDSAKNLLDDENNLGFEFREKQFHWKVTLHEISDDEDDQLSSESEDTQ